jgi:sulfur relay (sulfurtransferase) complex TusBCD TusD component (DsrE family)
MNVPIIINNDPYGSERAYDALRLAQVLQKRGPDTKMTVVPLGCATALTQCECAPHAHCKPAPPRIRHGRLGGLPADE